MNPNTNKIYVVNATSNNVTVIDGATNATTTVPVGTNPFWEVLMLSRDLTHSGDTKPTLLSGRL